MLLRCARCGSPGLFRRWVNMVERCPRCGHRFERADGYWLGAIMINTAVVFATFFAALVVPLVLLWPDPPWTGVLIFTLAVNAVVPVVFYPFSKTLWVAAELHFHPLDAAEIADADAHAAKTHRPET